MKNHTYAQQLAVAQASYFRLREQSRKRGKLGPNDHKGVAFYDKERMKKPLPEIVQPGDLDMIGRLRDDRPEYKAPPSWVKLPKSWGKWKPVPSNHFCAEQYSEEKHSRKASAEDYTLEPCEHKYAARRYDHYRPEYVMVTSTAKVQLTFSNGDTFYFASQELAALALPELLKIRKGSKDAKGNSKYFITPQKLRKAGA